MKNGPKLSKLPKIVKIVKYGEQKRSKTECDEYIRIFEYSNIFYTNIYSDIRSYQFSWYEYIRIFIRIIFLIRIYSDIRSYQNHTLLECDEYLNIRIFVSFSIRIFICIIFVSFLFIRIYSDIRSYRFLDTNIFGYSFVSKSIRMSHSVL